MSQLAAPPAPSAREELPEVWEAARFRPPLLQGGTWRLPDGRFESIQWLDLPVERELDLEVMERAYFAWVPRLSAEMVRPHWLAGPSGPLFLAIEPLGFPPVIRLEAPQLGEGQRWRGILGGTLAYPGGSFGFCQLPMPGGLRLVVSVRRLRARLPDFLYLRLQTPLHERSTYASLRELAACHGIHARRGWRPGWAPPGLG